MKLKSAVENLAWPVVQTGRPAELMALQRQFEVSQWWPQEQLCQAQFTQLSALAEHAAKNVPYYYNSLRKAGFRSGKPMNEEIWRRIPILTRAQVRDLGDKLHAKTIPHSFGKTGVATTGGSTGIPVRVIKTSVDSLMWESSYVRELLWHCNDLSGTIVNFNDMIAGKLLPHQRTAHDHGDGVILPNLQTLAGAIWNTGALGLMSYRQPVQKQAEFLLKVKPKHLGIRPTDLRLLLSYFRDHQLRLDSISYVWTLSEIVDESLRGLCRTIFGCDIVHNYTAAEIGYIALQCPSSHEFHVMGETQYVEILNDKGDPCLPGEIGRVIVTPLHNYAMPLLRYEIGDEAELGTACACGRGLPVLKRIVGRLENYILLKSGERRRVEFYHYKLATVEAILEFQLVQKTLDLIVLQLVVSRPLTSEELNLAKGIMSYAFGQYLAIDVTFHESLPRTSSGKLRNFISEVL
jgi:phenylacetate-CoA ligase